MCRIQSYLHRIVNETLRRRRSDVGGTTWVPHVLNIWRLGERRGQSGSLKSSILKVQTELPHLVKDQLPLGKRRFGSSAYEFVPGSCFVLLQVVFARRLINPIKKPPCFPSSRSHFDFAALLLSVMRQKHSALSRTETPAGFERSSSRGRRAEARERTAAFKSLRKKTFTAMPVSCYTDIQPVSTELLELNRKSTSGLTRSCCTSAQTAESCDKLNEQEPLPLSAQYVIEGCLRGPVNR